MALSRNEQRLEPRKKKKETLSERKGLLGIAVVLVCLSKVTADDDKREPKGQE